MSTVTVDMHQWYTHMLPAYVEHVLIFFGCHGYPYQLSQSQSPSPGSGYPKMRTTVSPKSRTPATQAIGRIGTIVFTPLVLLVSNLSITKA